MKSVLIPANASAQTMTIIIGAGGLGGQYSGTAQANGSDSSITFNATGSASITVPTLTNSALTAYGGGSGATNNLKSAISGGSGGGGCRYGSSWPTGAVALGNSTGTTSNYNYGNNGGSGVGTSGLNTGGICGGGGGAGTPGTDGQDNAGSTTLNGYCFPNNSGINCVGVEINFRTELVINSLFKDISINHARRMDSVSFGRQGSWVIIDCSVGLFIGQK